MPNSEPKATPQYREFEATQINQLMNALTSKEQLDQLKTKMDDDCLSVLNKFIDKNAAHDHNFKVLPPPELARQKAKKAWMKWIDEYLGKLVADEAEAGRCSMDIELWSEPLADYGLRSIGFEHEDEKEKTMILELLSECGYDASFKGDSILCVGW